MITYGKMWILKNGDSDLNRLSVNKLIGEININIHRWTCFYTQYCQNLWITNMLNLTGQKMNSESFSFVIGKFAPKQEKIENIDL